MFCGSVGLFFVCLAVDTSVVEKQEVRAWLALTMVPGPAELVGSFSEGLWALGLDF